MFCSKCGNEIKTNDKFCSSCGQEVNKNNKETMDISEIIKEFGKNKIEACKYIANTYNLSLAEAKQLVDNEYNKNNQGKSIWQRAKEQVVEQNIQKQEEKNRIKQLKKDKVPFCPKCHSTNLTAQKKGFGLLKGALGVATLGGFGITAAGIGKNKIILTCLNCGYQFKPGK